MRSCDNRALLFPSSVFVELISKNKEATINN